MVHSGLEALRVAAACGAGTGSSGGSLTIPEGGAIAGWREGPAGLPGEPGTLAKSECPGNLVVSK